MNNISIDVDNIYQVTQVYESIKVYRADSEAGVYSEITEALTRVALNVGRDVYFYTDSGGTADHWYKTSYYKADPEAESEKSDAFQTGSAADKIGYSFGNYAAPTGEWGAVVTPDDMRYTYLFGIDAVAQDVNQSEFQDEQFQFYIDGAVGDFERYLTIDIRRKKYITRPTGAMTRSRVWRLGVDYTDIENPYDFDPTMWSNYGFLPLRHFPVIQINRAVLYNIVKDELMDVLDKNWIRLDKATGHIRMFPTAGFPYGPFAVQSIPWRLMSGPYPDGFEIDYETGYESSDFVPNDLREIIAKWAAIKTLASVGDGLLAGFSSQSVSLDGLSESFSSTQSATSAYFGARIKQYQDEVKIWLIHNRYKFGAIPIGFVGV